jgi:diguanylate cyclase (GGDEF)-like protein
MKNTQWFRWFAIATMILLGVAAAVFTRAVDVSSEKLEQSMIYDWVWSGAQGRTEAAELEKRVIQLASPGDQASLDAAVLFHQILLSRIRTWESSDFNHILDEDPRMSAHFNTIVSSLDSLGDILQNLSDDDAMAQAIAQAGALRHAADRLSMGARTHSVAELAKVKDDLHKKQLTQKVLIVILFLGGFALVLVTSWQNRSLARGNAAIAGGARQLAESEERLSAVLANTTDGVMVLDLEWRVTFANQKAVAMLFPDQAYLGERIWDLRRTDGTRVFYKNYSRAMKQQCPVEFETYLAPLDAWLEVHAFPTPDNLTVFFREVTERRRLNDELLHLTRHDPLTDLANRTLFAERLSAALECGSRGCELTLMLIDLDDFKFVNDLRGHQIGDRLLQQVAGRLAGLVRQQDTVARLGGDEFAIIQPGPAAPDGGAGIARRISEALRAPLDIEGSPVTVAASIGIAMAPDHGSRPGELIQNADLALYRAKETKGTSLNYCVYGPAMQHHLQDRQPHRLELQRAPTQVPRQDEDDDHGDAHDLSLHNARITTALNHMSQGLCMFNADKMLIVCNERYASIYGIPPENIQPGTPFRQILQDRIDSGQFKIGDPEDYLRERIEAVEERQPSVKFHHLTDGRTIAITHCPLEDGGWVATHDDVTDMRRIEAKIAHMADHDELTDLPNRGLFRDELARALRRGECLALLCLDLDQFKAVNDALGHPLGDALLRQAADRLRQVTSEGDLIARLDGDSFAILQRDAQIPETARALAECVLATLRQPYELDGHQVIVGASIGIAGAPSDSGDADELLKMADMALYRCKLEGRGVFRFFEPEMDAKVQTRRGLEVDLRKALAGDELEIHYQPVVDIQADRVTGFEALLRWRHAVRGNVSPDEFVPLAEDIGVIGQLGAWVLEQACAEAARWPADVRLAVNLSPAQFVHRDLVGDVLAALKHSGLPADRLELEITETVMLQDTGATLATLHSLRDLGVHISLDDFGTGYSSLNLVRKFPFDRLKIDRSFIEDMNDDGGSLGIVRAVLALGNSQGMGVTAEGVETNEQLDRLRAEGCLEVQGFFLSPARPASEVAGLLTSVADKSRRVRTVAPIGHQGRHRANAHVTLVQ